MRKMSRRTLLGKGAQAVLAGGGALFVIPTLESGAFAKSVPKPVDYYEKLGVTPFINAAGTLYGSFGFHHAGRRRSRSPPGSR